MCTTQHDGKYYDKNGKRLYTDEEVLTASGSLGHTSGKPEELAEKSGIIAEATASYYSRLRTAG